MLTSSLAAHDRDGRVQFVRPKQYSPAAEALREAAGGDHQLIGDLPIGLTYPTTLEQLFDHLLGRGMRAGMWSEEPSTKPASS